MSRNTDIAKARGRRPARRRKSESDVAPQQDGVRVTWVELENGHLRLRKGAQVSKPNSDEAPQGLGLYRSLTLRGVVTKQSLFDEAFRRVAKKAKSGALRVVADDLEASSGSKIAVAFLENASNRLPPESSALLRDFQSYLLVVDKTERIIAIGLVLQALKAERRKQLKISADTLAAIDTALGAAIESGVIGEQLDEITSKDKSDVTKPIGAGARESSRRLDKRSFPLWDPDLHGEAHDHFQSAYAILPRSKRPTMGDVESHDKRFFEAMRQYARYHEKPIEDFFPREKGRRRGPKPKVISPEEAARILHERRERERVRLAKRRQKLQNQPK